MKKILFWALAVAIPLFSESSFEEIGPKIHDSWDCNNAYLFLDIELEEGMKFASTYENFTLSNGGIGAEIECLPLERDLFLSSNSQLTDVILTVHIFYDKNNCILNYEIFEKFNYESSTWFSPSKRTTSKTIRGKLTNIDIDMSKKPEFFIWDESINKGYFVFKKME